MVCFLPIKIHSVKWAGHLEWLTEHLRKISPNSKNKAGQNHQRQPFKDSGIWPKAYNKLISVELRKPTESWNLRTMESCSVLVSPPPPPALWWGSCYLGGWDLPGGLAVAAEGNFICWKIPRPEMLWKTIVISVTNIMEGLAWGCNTGWDKWWTNRPASPLIRKPR